MAKNNVYGFTKSQSLPVPAGTKSGDPVKSGAYVGVALTDRQVAMAANVPNTSNPVGNASVALDGTWTLPCADAVAAVGTALYIAGAGPFTVTTTDSGNTLLGYSADVIKGGAATGGTKAAGAGTINVTIG
jgi:predicted RecA/RadA family phage recombinase